MIAVLLAELSIPGRGHQHQPPRGTDVVPTATLNVARPQHVLRLLRLQVQSLVQDRGQRQEGLCKLPRSPGTSGSTEKASWLERSPHRRCGVTRACSAGTGPEGSRETVTARPCRDPSRGGVKGESPQQVGPETGPWNSLGTGSLHRDGAQTPPHTAPGLGSPPRQHTQDSGHNP